MRKFFSVATLILLVALPAVAVAQTGVAPAPTDAERQAISGLIRSVQLRWNPACDMPGFRDTHPVIRFVIGKDGRIVSGPDWTNPNSAAVWQTAADRAKAAVLAGQPYDGLLEPFYGKPLVISFDARQACH